MGDCDRHIESIKDENSQSEKRNLKCIREDDSRFKTVEEQTCKLQDQATDLKKVEEKN